jgi:hypothetical protein
MKCRGGPYNGREWMVGGDEPEGWRITLSVPTGKFAYDRLIAEYRPVLVKGTYTRKGDCLIWKEGIE